MQSERKFPVLMPIIIIIGLVLALAALIIIRAADKSHSSLPLIGQVPEFQFVRQDGTPFGLNNMKGKINVVDFIFTTCPGVCPIMSANMSGLYRSFRGDYEVQFISISVDPDRDSLSVLRQYAEGFGVNDNRWVFLWQPVNDVVKLSERGFLLPANDLPMGHSSRFVLVDFKGRIRGYYEGTEDASLKKLANDIRLLATEI